MTDFKSQSSSGRSLDYKQEEPMFQHFDVETKEWDEQRLAIHESVISRFQDGFEIRPAYYADDPNDHVSAFVREVYALTNFEYSRDRRQTIEVEELFHIPAGTAYRRSDSESVFVGMPRWFDSPFWKELLGNSVVRTLSRSTEI